MSYELIATLMFSTMMLMLLTGQRVFGAIGFVAVIAALLLWGDRGGFDIGFAAAMKLMKWYPLLTLPMFIFMGYVLSESKIADDLYKDVPCLDGWAARRTCYRDDRPDGADFRNEWIERCGHGNRVHHRPARAFETRLRQANGDGRRSSGLIAWEFSCRPLSCWCSMR